MLTSIRRIFCRRCFSWGLSPDCGDHGTPVERWANHNAKICSPEQLVEAHVINSIARDFEDWELVTKRNYWSDSIDFSKFDSVHAGSVDRILRNRRKHRNVKSVTIFWEHVPNGQHRNFNVNNVPFSANEGRNIWEAYRKIDEQRKATARIAAKALEDQKRLDRRWNLAEELLGFKRDEHGALVPVKTVEA
jgi:hypothetical protein